MGRIAPEVIEFLNETQTRCVECGSTYSLQIHHRVFRSEGQTGLQDLERGFFPMYNKDKPKKKHLKLWGLDDVQNLVILCSECHIWKLHNGDRKMNLKYKRSFTCPITGFNIPYFSFKSLR